MDTLGSSAPPLRVLSLDGGGIRGKSSLLILENIMEAIREAKGLDTVPKPCECFDLIGGTSTGGIIAIMLGRLGMTVDECIRAYDKLAQTAFTPKYNLFPIAPPKGAYSAQALTAAIKQTVRESCVDPSCSSQRRQGKPTVDTCPHDDAEFRNPSCTKTAVLAITKDNVDASPTLFTTYDTSASYQGCNIWQVARATSAATTFFKSIKVGRDNVEFIDAGFGCNNPCEVLIEEARRQFPGHSLLQILSIGTGLGEVVRIDDSRLSIVKALKKMASTSTAVATKLDRQYGDTGQYYRFNVDRGLQDVTLSDWKKTSTISAHTGNYLKDNQRAVKSFVNSFIGNTQVQEKAAALPIATTSCPARHYIPLPKNKHFVGRAEVLQQLRESIFSQGGHQRVAVFGLGGVGKTQAALQIAYEAKDALGFLVLWLPAITNANFQQACTEVVKRLAIQAANDEDPREVLQNYLDSDKAGKWLLVIDNADEMEIVFGSSDEPGGIHRFFPDNDCGRILFTTRVYDVAARVAGDGAIELKEMGPEEAKVYLAKKVQSDLVQDDAAVTELLIKLTHLPLAITQAAAFLRRNKVSIREYLELLDRTNVDKVELLSWEFHDRSRYEEAQNAVAITWQTSFNQICRVDTTAADLLKFISRIEPKGIPQSILPMAGSETQLVNAIGTLLGYAFLDRREVDKTYDMHSLVHLATQTWLKKQDDEQRVIDDAVAHLSRVFPTDDWENREVWREYLPHALRGLQEDSSKLRHSTRLGSRVGRCLMTDGRHKDAIEIFEHIVATKETLAIDRPSRLALQHALGKAYLENGQIIKAVELLEHIVAIRERKLAENHPSRLASQHVLAIAYSKNGQILEAVELLEHVVALEKTLAENHPNRLASQHALASVYLRNGQILEAVELLEHVVAVKKTLAVDHPNRLASQHALASAYLKNGQILEAVELLEHVVTIEKPLAESHPSRLASQHALAMAYLNNGQILKAVELLEHVVAIEKKTLAVDHPSRLASQRLLARAYEEMNKNPPL
ncbi:acyl transferase/acyl hydrolase/lysophospholipase [Xylariaceae sp. FL1651]|nr:acyl transferase/acyl hydrolase/lysophospholipase [Xylariaceae sp. FL1651]